MSRRLTNTVFGIVFGLALGVGAASAGWFDDLNPWKSDRTPEPATEAPSVEGNAWLEPDAVVGEKEQIHSRFALLAQRAAPAVVNVHTSRTVEQTIHPFGMPDLFGDLFGHDPFFDRAPRRREAPRKREYRVPSLGTGFVISADGYILTNHHVVDGVDEIEVRFQDGERAEAELVGEDPKTDLALIRVKGASDLPVLPLGDSDEILPGDWVVAIGNPFGLSHTVTVGIVSAKGREIGQGPYDDFIQTDAAINPGNSGGPLLNLRGEVVGINTAINPNANTIGFAVPSNLARSILPQLRETGHVVRGWLGVGIQPITQSLERAFDLKSRKGALVSQVSPDGPAAEAGIERGDVIVRFDGKPVTDTRDLPRLVASTPIGKTVEVEVLRGGKRRTLDVEIGELADAPKRVARAERSGLSGFGLEVVDLTPSVRRRFGVDEHLRGAVVARVSPDGPAANAGLRPGDVLLEVNREPVGSAADVAHALEGSETALVLIAREDANLFVTMERRD